MTIEHVDMNSAMHKKSTDALGGKHVIHMAPTRGWSTLLKCWVRLQVIFHDNDFEVRGSTASIFCLCVMTSCVSLYYFQTVKCLLMCPVADSQAVAGALSCIVNIGNVSNAQSQSPPVVILFVNV